ncbi:hypothetical protein ACIBH1_31465 [Nonomuraea sp. NPDC050663]|uniref:hypothetical protein n=1 Tax=Nonomuraea sp. NPDC050663 TaxID=3364370 RepID=UPI0037B8D5D7
MLTSAHVVEDAREVSVWFLGGLETTGHVLWCEDQAAAVEIHLPDRVEPVAYGTADRSRRAVLTTEGVAFPAWKRGYGRRDTFQLDGKIPVLSNLRHGTLELVIEVRPEADDRTDPWAGSSGSAVFVGGCLIGLVEEHNPTESLNRLRVRPANWNLSASQRADIGYSDPTTVPFDDGPGPGYHREIDSLRPAGGLREREAELDELVAFCAGEEDYLRWQGQPWTGKTALAATIALGPPLGVRVAAFFVDPNWVGHTDVTGFLESMTEQLAAIAGADELRPPSGQATLNPRFEHMLARAASACRGRGERLLLVVDGLDHDRGDGPGIAAHLPRRLPDGVRVLVTERSNPELPLNVPAEHPLRHCGIRELVATPYAAELELRARQDVDTVARSENEQSELLMLLTASGGGLTAADLAELAGLPVARVKWLLRGALGRLLRLVGGETWLFSHATLSSVAEELLADRLAGGRRRLRAWAAGYREQGWPERTPRYLLLSYGRELARHGEVETLVAYALDETRGQRLLRTPGGLSVLHAELGEAQRVLAAREHPDLAGLLRLALIRDQVTQSVPDVPLELPKLWARLGRAEVAKELAGSVADPVRRDEALAGAVHGLAEDGQPVRALELASEIEDGRQRGRALASVAAALARQGKPEAAADLARSIPEAHERVAAWSQVIKISGLGPLADEAEALALEITDREAAAWATAALVEALAAAGAAERAERLAYRISVPESQIWAVSAVAEEATDTDHRRELLEEAQEMARVTLRRSGTCKTLPRLLSALGKAEEWAAIESWARTIGLPYIRTRILTTAISVLPPERARSLARAAVGAKDRAPALAALATSLAARGLAEEAGEYAEQAARSARQIKESAERTRALVAVAAAYAAAGDRAEALRLARTIGSANQRVLVLAAAEADERELKEETERLLSRKSASRTRLLAHLARAHLVRGELDQAEELAALVPPDQGRVSLVTELVRVLANRDMKRAERLIGSGLLDATQQAHARVLLVKALGVRGENLALGLPEPQRSQALGLVVRALLDAGRVEDGLAVARRIEEHERRCQILARLVGPLAARRGTGAAKRILYTEVTTPASRAEALVELGLLDDARRAANRIASPERRSAVILKIVRALAADGSITQALELRDSLSFAEAAKAGAVLAEEVARLGRFPLAERLADRIAVPEQRVKAITKVVRVLASLGSVPRALRLADKLSPELSAGALIQVMSAAATRGKWGLFNDALTRLQITGGDIGPLVGLVRSVGLPYAGRLADMVEQAADPDRHAGMLTELAKVLPPDRARRVLARVLAGPSWQAALVVLEPEVLHEAGSVMEPDIRT